MRIYWIQRLKKNTFFTFSNWVKQSLKQSYLTFYIGSRCPIHLLYSLKYAPSAYFYNAVSIFEIGFQKHYKFEKIKSPPHVREGFGIRFFMLQQQKTTNTTASATNSIFLSWRKTQILSETCWICCFLLLQHIKFKKFSIFIMLARAWKFFTVRARQKFQNFA